MKIGDEFKVQLEGFHVANGYVEDFDGDDVIIVIPATRVKMGVSSQLAPKAPETDREFTALPEATDQTTSPAMTDVEPQTQQRQDAPDTPAPAAPPAVQETAQVMAETGGRSLKEVELDSSVLDD